MLNDLKNYITMEANKGTEKHGEFNSLHEAYAVMKEELEEADTYLGDCEKFGENKNF